MNSKRSRRFKQLYRALPLEIRKLAKQQYQFWKNNPSHPSLHFKSIHPKHLNIWSVRIGENHRAIALWETETVEWIWIGSHEEYEKILRNIKAATKAKRK
jgi:mRNA-degrading endonuclease RelE of RelBE toxin-antitoxin system